MYYCYPFCYRCRSGGILDERFPNVDCPVVQNRLERVPRYFLYISLAIKEHRGLSRAVILASNIDRSYRKRDTRKGEKSDFEKVLAFHMDYAEEAVQLISDGPAN